MLFILTLHAVFSGVQYDVELLERQIDAARLEIRFDMSTEAVDNSKISSSASSELTSPRSGVNPISLTKLFSLSLCSPRQRAAHW